MLAAYQAMTVDNDTKSTKLIPFCGACIWICIFME